MFSPEEVPVEKAMDATCQTPAHRDPSTGTSHFTAATRLLAPALGLGGTALHLRGVTGFRGTMAPWLRPCEPPPSPPPTRLHQEPRRRGCVGLCSRHRHSRMRPAARHGGHVSSVSPEAGPPSMCAPSPRPWDPVHGGLGALQLCGRPWTRFGRLRPTPPPTTSLFCSSQSPLSAFNV